MGWWRNSIRALCVLLLKFSASPAFFVMVVVVAVQVHAQGFKTGERLLPFGAEFVAFVAQVYPRFAVVDMGVCIIIVVRTAAQARIVVINVFFGQQVRIRPQIAFVNQTTLPDDVGAATIVFVAVGRQAVLSRRSLYAAPIKPFRLPKTARCCQFANRHGCRAGVSDDPLLCGNAVRRSRPICGTVLPCATRSFCQSDIDAAGREFFQIAAAQAQPQFARYAVFRHFSGIFRRQHPPAPPHCPSCTTALPARAGFRPVATRRCPPSGHGRAKIRHVARFSVMVQHFNPPARLPAYHRRGRSAAVLRSMDARHAVERVAEIDGFCRKVSPLMILSEAVKVCSSPK